MPSSFLTAFWRKLIMAQYEVDPAILQRRLPPQLELDLYHGRCFVSLVGFLFDRVRILGAPIPFHTRFEEINLRYYVRRTLPGGASRRGVIFLNEIVPRPAITLIANTLYGEAYTTAPTAHSWRHSPPTLEVAYEWKHRRLWHRLGVRAEDCLLPMPSGSLEEFITEHYWGYTAVRGGGTAEYAVEHPRWETYPVRQYRIACDFASLYGPDFAHLSARQPEHILLAGGAPVSIRWGNRIA